MSSEEVSVSQNRVLVIGFMGLAGAGKTSVAKALAQELGEPSDDELPDLVVRVQQFAAPIKRASEELGFAKGTDAYRRFCQFTGALGRELQSDWWIKDFQKWLATESANTTRNLVVLVDDVRYRNEMALCDILFYIQPYPGKEINLSSEQLRHESEHLARLINDTFTFVPEATNYMVGSMKVHRIDNEKDHLDLVVYRIFSKLYDNLVGRDPTGSPWAQILEVMALATDEKQYRQLLEDQYRRAYGASEDREWELDE